MPENAPGSVKASGLFIYAENHRDRENLRSPKIALLRWGGRNIDPLEIITSKMPMAITTTLQAISSDALLEQICSPKELT